VWIGDPDHLPAGTPVALLTEPSGARAASASALPVLPLAFDAPAAAGTLDPRNASGVIAAIEQGVALTRSGQTRALCTAPIHKQALYEGAGFAHPGHTEFLAYLDGGADVVMMLASDALRVVPATIHIPLQDVPAALTPALLEQVIRTTHAGLIRDFGLPAPRIALSGLNPHAGEGGAMGQQDADVIAPVIARLAAEGMDLRGPLPADTMFHAAARKTYDAAIAMYHDQALIPIKTLDFDRGVNVTLGLSFVRTSPDHGTALDIAGKGLANPASLIEALRMAHHMGANR